MPIPKKIFTAWFSESGEIPEHIQKCIESQKIDGYEHKVITLQDLPTDNKYINECLANPYGNKKWVKLTDYVRMQYLLQGCWFLDADVEIFKDKNFDMFLNEKFVICEEGCETLKDSIVLGVSVIGSEPNHPLVKEWIKTVEKNFSGLDNLCYESSMDILNSIGPRHQSQMCLLQPDYFFPFNHQSRITRITDRSICIHHFGRTWVDSKNKESDLPTVSIIIPHLGNTERRKLGLQKCLDSIEQLNYPRHLIDIQIIEGQETVPQKVKKGVEQSKGEYIVYAANDMMFYPDCILNAVKVSKELDRALVSFNEGHLLADAGNICTHFICRRDFIQKLDGKNLFCLDMKHCGVDNYLWAQADKLNNAIWCEDCKIEHDHFSKTGVSDLTYEKGWQHLAQDRETLKRKLEGLDYVQS